MHSSYVFWKRYQIQLVLYESNDKRNTGIERTLLECKYIHDLYDNVGIKILIKKTWESE